MGWFRFKGKDSRECGILISAMPERVRPPRRVKAVEVPGKDGDLTIDEEAYDAYTLSLECSTRGSDHLDEIVTWLDGSGELILSTEPDRVYRASIYNKISIADVVYLYNKFLLQFRVQPFKYSTNPFDDMLELTSPTIILNSGTVYSQPKITIYGSGDITLTVNGEDFPIYSVDGGITIDSEMMEVYKGTVNQNSKYGAMTFPRLEVGENSISWTGNVTKVVIIPNWRWL